MNELKEKRTPELIGAEIRMYTDAGRRLSLLCGIEIGRRLVEAKELLEHGEWLPWLERETEFSDRSAQRYMKLFDEYGASQLGLFGPETNTPTLSDLPISKAFALLSVPESDRAEFAEEVNASGISVRELEQKIREREIRIETQSKQLAAAGAKIEELSKLNQELESRPIEVAVERDEAAIAAAAKEAREKAEAEAIKQANKVSRAHDKTLKELHEKLAAVQRERDSLLQKAETDGGEADKKLAEMEQQAEKIRAELEETKKKLKASDADVTKFGVWFSQMQRDFNEMTEALRQVNERDEETGKKLKVGAVTLMKNMLKRLNPEEKI